MKKSFVKSVSSRLLAAAVGTAMMIQANAPAAASAAENTGEYISEVFISYGKNDTEAKQRLKDSGYTILDQNLNENAEGGISFLGLGSEARSVYLGYKTTTDSDLAIRDMRVMNMDGDYSYDEYEKVLSDKAAEIKSFISTIKTVLSEYRENYSSGKARAKIAHDKLNLLIDDDCNYSPLGDLLLKKVREECAEDVYNTAPEEFADMTTLVMQGNISYVSSVMTDLCMAADTADDSWLARLKQGGGTD